MSRIKANITSIIVLTLIVISSTYAFKPTMPRAEFISPQTVRQWQLENRRMTIIDVREEKEYNEGHIEHAINIPYTQLEDRLDEIATDRPQIFYCIHSSWRAPYSANLLKDKGFKDIFILEGGIAAWNSGGQIIYAADSGKDPNIAQYPEDIVVNLEHPQDRIYKKKMNLTLQELSFYDGKDGRTAFVAVDGVIYDVTNSRLWRGGEHDPSHHKAYAGTDVSEILHNSAPHGKEMLEVFPIVGYLTE